MPEPHTAHTVLVVDDHALLRVGLVITLETEPRFRCCGEASTPDEAREMVERLRPEAVILDLNMGGRDGFDLIEDLLVIAPEVRLLVYTGLAEAHYARRALRAGARGYLSKKTPLPQLLEALSAMMRGDLAVSGAVRQELLNPEGRQAKPGAFALLSPRELQILQRMGEEESWAGTAASLGLSDKTIGSYRERIKAKLGLRTAAELKEAARALAREQSAPGAPEATPPPEG